MAYKLGAGNESEDIVQEMYIRLHKYIKDPSTIITDGKPNMLFIWVTLRNIVRSVKGSVKVIDTVALDDFPEWDIVDLNSFDHKEAESFEYMVDLVYDTSSEMHWYYDKLFKLYYQSDLSMRDISKGSKISLKNIFDTIKKTRTYVKEKLKEDYQDYKNQDYDHLKRGG
tara:strand:- start:13511 stop:14017 length:507 start_codon:yes stop_codon:yes gene_type:complete